MKSAMKLQAVTRTAAAQVALCASALLASPLAAAVPLSLAIAAGNFDEHCVKLEKGVELRFRFKASGPVDFNIHHHRANEVLYPVKREGVRRFGDRFRAPAADEYCLMWENKGQQPVTVRGSVWR
jgi:hypothetical protein